MFKKKEYKRTALDLIVINSIPVPAGMAKTSHAGHQSGTEDTASRTAQDSGQFRPFRPIPAVPGGTVRSVNPGTGHVSTSEVRNQRETNQILSRRNGIEKQYLFQIHLGCKN
jgi:hypothetical protein